MDHDLVIQETGSLTVQNDSPVLEIQDNQSILVIPTPMPQVIDRRPVVVIQSRGIQGPTGLPGTGAQLQLRAGSSISAYKVLVVIGGLVYQADPTDLTQIGRFVGVSSNGGAPGDLINIAYTGTLPGGSWTADVAFYAGANGALSTLPDSIGAGPRWLLFLGTSVNTDTIVLTPGVQIQRG